MNGVTRTDCNKDCDLSSDINEVILKFTSDITSCENMFYGLNNLIKIDLSNFNSVQPTTMKNMLSQCINLKEVNFGNMDTSKVIDMEGLFSNCNSLISINFTNFDSSSLENAREMFLGCSSLASVDLSSFNTENLKDMYQMFCNCVNLISIDLSNFDTSNVDVMDRLFMNCYSLKYADLQNFSGFLLTSFEETFYGCWNLIYVNLRNFRILNPDIIPKFNFDEIPSNAKFCIEDSTTKDNLFSEVTIDCSDFCLEDNVYYNPYDKKCYCKDYYKFEYNNKCYHTCPTGMYPIFDNYLYKCKNNLPENYYFDNNDNAYKECIYYCKKCSKGGDSYNHNCDECRDEYTFLDDVFAINNSCYLKCSNYYYFSVGLSEFSYQCCDICPDEYNKIIEPKKRCIDDCKKDNKYIYEYNNECYKVCPDNTKTYEKEKICLDSCANEQFEYNNML